MIKIILQNAFYHESSPSKWASGFKTEQDIEEFSTLDQSLQYC